MSAEQRKLITTVPSASQTVMSMDEEVSPLTPLTQDTDTRPEYSARTKTTPRRSLLLEERGPVPSTEEGLEDAMYCDCDLYSHDLRHRFVPDADQRMTRWFRGIVCVHPRGSPAVLRRSQHRCNVCLGPAHGAEADCDFIPLCRGCSLECDFDIQIGRCASCPFRSLFEKFEIVSDNDRSIFPIHERVPIEGLASTIVPRPLNLVYLKDRLICRDIANLGVPVYGERDHESHDELEIASTIGRVYSECYSASTTPGAISFDNVQRMYDAEMRIRLEASGHAKSSKAVLKLPKRRNSMLEYFSDTLMHRRVFVQPVCRMIISQLICATGSQ